MQPSEGLENELASLKAWDGGPGDDHLIFNEGIVLAEASLSGGTGNDKLDMSSNTLTANRRLLGGYGDDIIYGGAGTGYSIFFGDFYNELFGTPPNDLAALVGS